MFNLELFFRYLSVFKWIQLSLTSRTIFKSAGVVCVLTRVLYYICKLEKYLNKSFESKMIFIDASLFNFTNKWNLFVSIFFSKRSIVGMTMYNQATQEIAKPSELLTSVRAYMTVLQSIENYVQIDITRVFNNVLLQQTQHLDSHGEPTITSLYTNW